MRVIASESHSALTAQLKQRALELGFAAAGCCPAVTIPAWERFQEWLARGYAGQMRYLPERREAYRHPESILEGVRSLVLLTMDYRTSEPVPPGPTEGRVARYAWGAVDYHDVIHERLGQLAASVRQWSPGAKVRGVVDTAPLLERDYARLAGLGWIGKNTLLLTRHGSSFFLAALLTDLELAYDAAFETDHCGTCRACLDACPTQAFPEPYVLDATRCISYLTIELREAVPRALRAGLGEWVFGCDVCQDVCPWNARAPRSAEPAFVPRPDHDPLDLPPLLALDDAEFRARFARTPLWRAKRRGLLRSAALVLGNRRSAAGLAALSQALLDPDPTVRGAAAWALGQYDDRAAREALQRQADCETDPVVRQEIELALVKFQSARANPPGV